LTDDDLTDLALLHLDAVVSIEAPASGPPTVCWATLRPPGESGPAWQIHSAAPLSEFDVDAVALLDMLDRAMASAPALRRVAGAEGALLVGLTLSDAQAARQSLAELRRMAEAVGLVVLDESLQVRPTLDPRTAVGKGKIEALLLRAMALGATVLVFDRELTPSQLRNVAQLTDLKVLDRTQLILDLFARRARTVDGRLQVELAQLRYRLPRLAIMPTAMSRLTGGVGGRGPGETRLEINRRRAQQRADRLTATLARRAAGRTVRRSRRRRADVPTASLVGYTNAGKSSLLNALTGAGAETADAPFVTLDTTTRRVRFPEAREIVLTDTVGFLKDLPATLVAAFRSTLEELREADLLVHVVDASDPGSDGQIVAVTDLLDALGLGEAPVLRVWNKCDRLTPEAVAERVLTWGGVAVSATTFAGLPRLLDAIERRLFLARSRA
jgi:GTP-binding protein HflX